MKNSPERDPRRWKDTPTETLVIASGTEAEIAAATRLLHELAPPDELRLAQLARRAAQEGVATEGRQGGRQGVKVPVWSLPVHWNRLLGFPGWTRTAVVVVISLLVGGVAAAVSGNFIRYFKKQISGPAVASLPTAAAPRSHGRKRRWRLDLSGPTELDPSVGPDGTEVPVVSGEAAVSGAELPGRVALDRGASWRPSNPPGDVASAATRSTPSPGPVPGAIGPQNPVVAPAPGVVPGAAVARRRLAFTEPTRAPTARPRTGRLEEGSLAPGVSVAVAAPAPTEPPPLIVPLPLGEGAGVAPAVRLRPTAAAPPVESEATMVARALARLRRDHDPAGALAALDQRDRSYSGGDLRREAALARAEALLGLNRNSEALKVLDGVTLQPSAADRRARLARAELRAEEGHRSEAIADFDRVLGTGDDDTLAERALYGRAVCRLRGGDLGGARIDLRAYLVRFPEGQHQTEVQQSLGRLGG